MAKSKSSLSANFIYNFISQVLTLIVPLITTPYIARILHEEGNGQYSYAASIITYFILIANLGFTTYGQREMAKCGDDAEKKRQTFWSIVVARSFSTIISLGALFAILYTVGFGESYNTIILVLSIQVVAVIFDLQFYYQGIENFKSLAIRSIIMKVAGLIAIFVFVKSEDDVWVYALCLSVITICSNFIMWPSALKDLGFFKKGDLSFKTHYKGTLLIFLPALAVTIYSVCDKTMIGLLSSNPDYDNGCYEQAYKINSVALLLVTIIDQVFVSRNANELGNGNIEGLKNNIYFACNYVWLVGCALIAGFAVLSGNLSSWFLGDGYTEVPLLMQIMSVRFICSGLGNIFGNELFIVIGKEKYTFIATIIAAVINFPLNAVLIIPFGAVGAAIATAVAEFLVTLVYIIILIKRKDVSVKKIIFMSWKYILSAVVMFVVIYFIQSAMNYSIGSFILITVIGCVVYGAMLLVLRDKFFISLIKFAFDKVKSIIKRIKTKKDEG
ncbi:MAG: polysaccharide biosynthesis C-terminal domain-containing protein [Clostridia bacterium]|nr:polysaccharide biosynthesis C-terminal domain-containing protein [Clostridia bacterium]